MKIFEQNLNNKKGDMVGKMAIIVGGMESDNPKAELDSAALRYAGNEPISQFVEIHLDNPWVRIIIKGINEVDYETFSDSCHI